MNSLEGSGRAETNLEQATQFYLKKWYLDAADAFGNLYIGYWASLQWRGYQLHAYQHLWHTFQQGVKTDIGLSKQPPPYWATNGTLTWEPAQSQMTWCSEGTAQQQTLIDNENGMVHWVCHQPKAEATIEHPAIQLQSWGYTETIEMTLPIWKLPVNKLYWGRCHTAHHALIWIHWEGEPSKTFVWLDGCQDDQIVIQGATIRGNGFQLTISQRTPLRRGQLISTLFKPFKRAINFLPKSIFLADENKWYGRGLLTTATGSEPATIIFEEVIL